SPGSGSGGRWASPQPLDAAHAAGVGGGAHGIHLGWSVAGAAGVRPGDTRGVRPVVQPRSRLPPQGAAAVPLFARRGAPPGYGGSAVLGRVWVSALARGRAHLGPGGGGGPTGGQQSTMADYRG